MSSLPGSGAIIRALGHYQPARVLTNADISELVDTTDEWIQSRVGIKTRHIAAPDETVADMATQAAGKALVNAGVFAADVDMVLVATCTAKDRSPNTAARVARSLDIPAPVVLDINTVCSGFSHALAIAQQAIAAGSANHALVIGVEKFSEFTNWSDRSTCVIPGDGAGAAVVSRSAESGISPVVWGSAPEMSHTVRVESPDFTLAQDGTALYRWILQNLPDIALRICTTAGLTPADLAGVVFHQANLRIIDQLATRLGAVNAVIARDVVESGNTSAASIPLAFSKLVDRGEIEAGAPVLLFGFGGGLSYSGQVVRCP
jgi:3-oxoacyl-[acyl-carrier-protein] synthase-3